jgi:FMNH2-dependent dimethyl sulfone monooxygenase
VAREKKRELKVLMPVTIIARDSEKEARAFRQEILDHADYEAAKNMLGELTTGGGSWPQHTLEEVILGIAGFKMTGTPDYIVDTATRLSAAGIDGLQLTFFNYLEDLEYFGERILPAMNEAGLRTFI